MSEPQIPDAVDKELEIEIIRAFGSAIIEFEAVLFQKVVLSSARMLITVDMFSEKLLKMAELGYISPLTFHGKACWRKLVDEDEIESRELKPEEVREILEKGHSKAVISERIPPSASDQFVTEAKNVAQDVLQLVQRKIVDVTDDEDEIRSTLHAHFKAMREALADSEEDFLEYARQNLPEIAGTLQLILRAKGCDILLPALRIIEYGLTDASQ